MYKFDFAYPWLPYRLKYVLFAGRFASAIDQSTRLGSSPSLHQFTSNHPYLLRLVKDDGRLAIHLDIERLFRVRQFFNAFWKRVPVMAGFFARTDAQVLSALADITDDGAASFEDGVMSFCSGRPDACLVPDENFLRSGGYARYRIVAAAHADNWSMRNDVVLWRGAPSDAGRSSEIMDENDPALKPRLRLSLKLRDVPKVDAKIYRSLAGQKLKPILKKNRIWGEFIPAENWIAHKFALDIDGVSNAWGNFFVRLLLGCCVLKVASPRGYRQWYYDKLVPWQHYVPVQSDMSDLLEKIDWCRAHDAQCRDIAAAGQKYAFARTVETETALTVRRLNERLGAAA